jgi:hypothetical protein
MTRDILSEKGIAIKKKRVLNKKSQKWELGSNKILR